MISMVLSLEAIKEVIHFVASSIATPTRSPASSFCITSGVSLGLFKFIFNTQYLVSYQGQISLI